MARSALIIGVTGQDGAYLARHLLARGYVVYGTSRDLENRGLSGLKRLGIADDVKLSSVSPTEFRDVSEIVHQAAPDEIYNLSGQSSVALSFSQPNEAFHSIVTAQLQLVEVLRHANASARLFNACSAECFGQVADGVRCDETTPFRPVSPYGIAKASAFFLTASYREAYGLFCASGILFNHESPLRPERFVTRKIVRAAVNISRGKSEGLALGNLDIWRDWGHARDTVDAMWRMLQHDTPDDYVVATGVAHTLAQFVEAVFARFDLDWRNVVSCDSGLQRPLDIPWSCGDPSRAQRELGWTADTDFGALVDALVDAELAAIQRDQ